MKHQVSETELYTMVTQVITEQGSQKKAAAFLGVTPPFLHDVLQHRRPLGRKIPAKLGYQKIVLYQVVQEDIPPCPL